MILDSGAVLRFSDYSRAKNNSLFSVADCQISFNVLVITAALKTILCFLMVNGSSGIDQS